jgi:hypothetical protein
LSGNLGAVWLLLVLGTAMPAAAQEVALPAAVHLPLLVKVLSFDRNFSGRGGETVVVGVLYQAKYRASATVADEVRQALGRLSRSDTGGYLVRVVSIDLDASVDPGQAVSRERIAVLYVGPLRAYSLADITSVTRSAGVTTVTGVPDYVETGLAIGIDLRGGRPEIVVNLAAAKAEGADLSARLLGVARVIGATEVEP